MNTDKSQSDLPSPTIPHIPTDTLAITAFHGCYGGDTCSFDLADLPPVFGKNIIVRLVGIDTPEIKGRCALERAKALQSKRFVEEIISRGKDIKIVHPMRDTHFRLLAQLYVDGTDMGTQLVESGLAVRYDGDGKSRNWCSTPKR